MRGDGAEVCTTTVSFSDGVDGSGQLNGWLGSGVLTWLVGRSPPGAMSRQLHPVSRSVMGALLDSLQAIHRSATGVWALLLVVLHGLRVSGRDDVVEGKLAQPCASECLGFQVRVQTGASQRRPEPSNRVLVRDYIIVAG